MKKVMLSIAVCSALMGACSKSSTNPSYTPDCSGAAKSFASDASPMITKYCTGCHANYSGYAGIYSGRSGIRSSIVNGTMPTGKTMTTAEKNSVVCWIDSGAPNN